ncbi:C40 family peptidase [Mesobacillus boroniphilus]|uniref:Cell wall lytic activity n=1 Tax=Mesobacillus boroniphilus JCM 21738 TaxID=1294265 RepID=W4RV67_9BACI|nr:LysM peptidoglycan-binding domain-containing C40 family peptidase [Mesobacillus boroniphilus]GAE47987.1 cell wall lytic activity [Mesobacillus boroniphilus JCM 21738]
MTADYLVKSGDTLSKIAFQHGVTVTSIKQWNNLKSDLIYVGQKLMLHTDNDPKSVTSPANESPVAAKPGSRVNLFGEQTAETIAKELIGVPYKWAGNTPDGFDCSGFIYYVYNQTGKTINRYSSADYFNRAYYVNDPQPGDLVFFANTYIKGISHMGIYIGNNEFIHASDGGGVIISSLSSPYYQKHFDSFKRFY